MSDLHKKGQKYELYGLMDRDGNWWMGDGGYNEWTKHIEHAAFLEHDDLVRKQMEEARDKGHNVLMYKVTGHDYTNDYTEPVLVRSSTLSDELKEQGESKEQSDMDFNPVSLVTGIAVELEHTPDVDAAKEIAKDHLKEDEHYYNGNEWKEDAVKHLTDKDWEHEVVGDADSAYGDELESSLGLFTHGVKTGLKLFNSRFFHRAETESGVNEMADKMLASGFELKDVMSAVSGGTKMLEAQLKDLTQRYIDDYLSKDYDEEMEIGNVESFSMPNKDIVTVPVYFNNYGEIDDYGKTHLKFDNIKDLGQYFSNNDMPRPSIDIMQDGNDVEMKLTFEFEKIESNVSKYNGCDVTGMENGAMSSLYDSNDSVVRSIMGEEGADRLMDRIVHGEEPSEALITSVDNELTIDEIMTIQDALREEPVVAQIESNVKCCPVVEALNRFKIQSHFTVVGEMPSRIAIGYKANGGDMSNVKEVSDNSDATISIKGAGNHYTTLELTPLGDGMYTVDNEVYDPNHVLRQDLEMNDLITDDELSMILLKIAMYNNAEDKALNSGFRRILSGLPLRELSIYEELVNAGIDKSTASKIEDYTTSHSSNFNLNELAKVTGMDRSDLVAKIRPVWKKLGLM